MIYSALRQPVASVNAIFHRFPLATLSITLFTICMTTMLSFRWHRIEEASLTILLCLALGYGVFGIIAIQLYGERKNTASKYIWLMQIIWVLAISVLIIGKYLSTLEYSMLSLASFLAIVLAPYACKQADDNAFWSFTHTLALLILRTIIIGGIAYAAISALFATIGYLFSFKPSYLYWISFCLIACFLCPMLVLYHIPKDFRHSKSEECTGTSFLLRYLLLPLAVTYAIILHLYAAMILITGDMPKGAVATIVLSYASIALLCYFLAYGLREAKGMIAFYTRYIGLMLAMPMMLYAAAIGIRISDYGITDARYALVMSWIWLTISIGAILYPCIKRPVFYSLASACILLLIPLIPPLSPSVISTNSQLAHLQAILEENDLLKNGTITQKPVDDVRIRAEISDKIDYLQKHKQLHRIYDWFAGLKGIPSQETFAILPAQNVMEWMKLKYLHTYQRKMALKDEPSSVPAHEAVNLLAHRGESYDIEGYNQLISQIQIYTHRAFSATLKDGTALELRLEQDNPTSSSLMVIEHKEHGILLSLPLEGIMKQQHTQQKTMGIKPVNSYQFHAEQNGYHFRFIVTGFRATHFFKQGYYKMTNLQGMLLIKKEQ